MNTKVSGLRAKFGVICAILLLAGLAGCGQSEEFVKTYTVEGRANVRVLATYAFVRVTTSDDPKVQFNVNLETADWWTPTVPISSRKDGNTVEISAIVNPSAWWGWGHFGNHRLNIAVRMPENADLRLETSNGEIDVSSLKGNIWIHTSNANISAEQLSGSIDIGSTNGSIGAIGLDGTCELVTTNGSIEAAGRFDSLDITSSNGAVNARVESGSRMSSGWSIRTTNSQVDLTVPTDFKANLDASTTNGRISSNLPVTMQGYPGNSQLDGALNGGGPELSIHTTNGGIRIRGI